MINYLIENFHQDLKEKIEDFETQVNFRSYTNLLNCSIFFMIIIKHSSESKYLIEQIFDNNSKLVKDILTILKVSRNYKKNKILQIFCNLFFDEYKDIFFSNDLDNLFILNNEKFTKLNIEGTDIYPKDIYVKILNILKELEFTYEQYFTDKYFHFEEEDKSLCIFF